MPITTDLDRVRLEIGDTDVADPLLSDDEIGSFISARSIVYTAGTVTNVPAAAADAAQAIAAKFARGFNFQADGQAFNRSERVNHYLTVAAALRNRAGGTSVETVSSGIADET